MSLTDYFMICEKCKVREYIGSARIGGPGLGNPAYILAFFREHIGHCMRLGTGEDGLGETGYGWVYNKWMKLPLEPMFPEKFNVTKP